MSVDHEPDLKRLIFFQKIKSVAMCVMAVGMVILTVTAFINATTIRKLENQQACELILNSDMRRATGLGLVAVSESDNEALRRQANLMRDIANRECER